MDLTEKPNPFDVRTDPTQFHQVQTICTCFKKNHKKTELNWISLHCTRFSFLYDKKSIEATNQPPLSPPHHFRNTVSATTYHHHRNPTSILVLPLRKTCLLQNHHESPRPHLRRLQKRLRWINPDTFSLPLTFFLFRWFQFWFTVSSRSIKEWSSSINGSDILIDDYKGMVFVEKKKKVSDRTVKLVAKMEIGFMGLG